MKSRTVGAFIPQHSGKSSDQVKSYGRGRVCEAWGCNTVLSAYNPAHFCFSHERARALRRP